MHTYFHDDSLRRSSDVKIITINFKGYNVGITDDRDLWRKSMRWPGVA
jgi:hypothetical protein